MKIPGMRKEQSGYGDQRGQEGRRHGGGYWVKVMTKI